MYNFVEELGSVQEMECVLGHNVLVFQYWECSCCW